MPPPKSRPAHTHRGRVTCCQRQAIRLEGVGHLDPGEAGFDACDAPQGVNSNGLHAGEINHHAALVRPIPGHTMASAAHGHGQLLAAGKRDGADHIVLVSAAHDQGRVPVDHPVPDLASAVVVVVAWRDQCAM